MNKNILILDAGGVIIEDLTISFWTIIAAKSTRPTLEQDSLYATYKSGISEKLWTGQLSEEHFLQFLTQYDIVLSKDELREIIKSCLLPLPAYERVKIWANDIPIFIMSNHLTEWLMPALAPLKPYITDYYVSDAFKVKKPTTAWFEQISCRHEDTHIMFVDNTMHNLVAAKQVGWSTVFADSEHKWITEIENWLKTLKNS